MGRVGLMPLLMVLLCFVGAAAANPVTTDNVTARLVTERKMVAPGGEAALALVLELRPGWHTYWRNPGDSGEPPSIEWDLPQGVSVGPIRWPHPDLIRVGPLANYGYSGAAVHLIDLAVPADWSAGRPVKIVAAASWLVCEEHCVPESAELALTVPTAGDAGPTDPSVEHIFADARGRIPRAFPARPSLMRDADGAMRLAIDRAALPERMESVWFFPHAWGLVEPSAGQPFILASDQLTLTLTPGAAADHTALDGVLVADSMDGPAAYEVSPVRAARPPDHQRNIATGAAVGLPIALIFALLGGLILNLMPCVFPVLAMKALSLSKHGSESGRRRRMQGLAYTAGVLVFFALVAALLLGLRAGGHNLGWGYQLQYPPFVALMAYLFCLLGLSLAGAVTLGSRLMGLGAAGPSEGIGGAFVTGAVAALVAAPCTAPFMGAAIGYAVTLHWPLALAVMLTLGLGMALPYLLLTLIPGASRILPKPGGWMENLKQFLSFPMFATAAWLVWVLSVQTGPDGVGAVLAGMVLITFAVWAWERSRGGRWRFLGAGAAFAGLAAGLLLGVGVGRTESVGSGDAQSELGGARALAAEGFSPARLSEARAASRPVLVNMTAAWCITCLVNERVALSTAAVTDAFESLDLLYLKGDWTNRDPVITDYLAGFGRNGVPLYVFYPPAGEPRVLPQILTASIVLDTLYGPGSAEEQGGVTGY